MKPFLLNIRGTICVAWAYPVIMAWRDIATSFLSEISSAKRTNQLINQSISQSINQETCGFKWGFDEGKRGKPAGDWSVNLRCWTDLWVFGAIVVFRNRSSNAKKKTTRNDPRCVFSNMRMVRSWLGTTSHGQDTAVMFEVTARPSQVQRFLVLWFI